MLARRSAGGVAALARSAAAPSCRQHARLASTSALRSSSSRSMATKAFTTGRPSRIVSSALHPGSRRAFSTSKTARYATATDAARPTPTLTEEDSARLFKLRNVGISAHIDSGKTTLTERVLFYTGRIKAIHEVRGRDSVGAKMDSMELEREKGITIQSAATFCDWAVAPERQLSLAKDEKDPEGRFNINIIDTPGHVDFTIEVERALRVLDGAVLVLCSVSGVQSQTITVDRQMRRYNVPRICFVNKMDRAGANPWRVIDQLKQKLRLNAAPIQIPIGAEADFAGVVDLVRMKVIRNSGEKGVVVEESDDIPADLIEMANQKRTELIEAVADADDEMADMYLNEEPISNEQLASAIRRATTSLKFAPVLMGTALGNKGVQPLLDALCLYLPNPKEVRNTALDVSVAKAVVKEEGTDVAAAEKAAEFALVPAEKAPLVGLAFKLEEGKFGQLTYLRVYQGALRKGGLITNVRTGKKIKVPRLVRMHSDEMEDVDGIGAGEICAMFGVECSTGDTFTDGTVSYSMSSMFVPEPVISLAIRPKGQESPNFSRALNRFQKEDPTFRVHVDAESQETIISGMGELHLDIYIERMKREYNVPCVTGKPRVAFRETITSDAPFLYTHKKQTGGAGQYGKVQGRVEPMEMDEETGKDTAFQSIVTGGNIPAAYIPAVEKGFRDALERGPLTGHPVTGCKFILEDGAAHVQDSSELAFRLAGQGAFREAFAKATPVVLEPVMKVEIIAPIEFQGSVIGGINQRKGTIVDTETREDEFTLLAEVSLNDMFGYSSQLRGMTQGKGEYSMTYLRHAAVMPNVQKDMMDDYTKFRKA